MCVLVFGRSCLRVCQKGDRSAANSPGIGKVENFVFAWVQVILVNHKPLGNVRNLCNSLLGASTLSVFDTGSATFVT